MGFCNSSCRPSVFFYVTVLPRHSLRDVGLYRYKRVRFFRPVRSLCDDIYIKHAHHLALLNFISCSFLQRRVGRDVGCGDPCGPLPGPDWYSGTVPVHAATVPVPRPCAGSEAT